jgi:hypothetical protein
MNSDLVIALLKLPEEMEYCNVGSVCGRVCRSKPYYELLERVGTWALGSNETGADGTRGERNNRKKNGEEL